MAVQAQYPSNVLLLNRNGQESKNMLGINNYPLLQPPPQPGGGGFLLDQSHLLYTNEAAVNNPNNNGKNPRKRGREVATSATAATTTAANNNNNHVNPFNLSLQNHHHQYNHHHPQLIELSQLHQQPHAVISTGLKLSFGDQQVQQQRQQNPNHNSSSSNNIHCSLSSPVLVSLFSDDLANQIKQQSDELNQFIHAQGEQLQRTIAEKRQRHYRALLGATEKAVALRVREKEAELANAARRHAELEARAAQLGAESQVWQAKARAQEAQAASLQAQLQQAMLAASGGAPKPADRDGLASGEGEAGAEDAESAYIDPERVAAIPMKQLGTEGVAAPACRVCRTRAATVVILPCRHLSVCVECDGVVQACPVCLGLRNSSVEVYLT